MNDYLLSAEWAPQSGVQLTWPHEDTDWRDMLDEVEACFTAIAREIAARERLLIVAPEPEQVRRRIAGEVNLENVRFAACPTNDTWARDHAGITLVNKGGRKCRLLDFCFNGWGLKFAADRDNLITRRCCDNGIFHAEYENRLNFVLEGGSIDSDGKGSLLTSSECLLSPNRNGEWDKPRIFLRQERNRTAQQEDFRDIPALPTSSSPPFSKCNTLKKKSQRRKK